MGAYKDPLAPEDPFVSLRAKASLSTMAGNWKRSHSRNFLWELLEIRGSETNLIRNALPLRTLGLWPNAQPAFRPAPHRMYGPEHLGRPAS